MDKNHEKRQKKEEAFELSIEGVRVRLAGVGVAGIAAAIAALIYMGARGC